MKKNKYMQIAGIQKTTLVDYPGKVAATVFTRGCSFRCGFCHNPELVIPEEFSGILFDEGELLSFLKLRIGKLQAVCITGGEPTIQKDIREFIKKIKEMGYLVKLDTNGSRPEILEKIIADGNIDYIAMDIKSSLDKYPSVAIPNSKFLISNQIPSPKSQKDRHSGLDPESSSALCHSERSEESRDPSAMPQDDKLISDIRRSIDLIMDSGIDYEFRTTVCHPIHEVEDFAKIGEFIKGAKRYYIQNFVESKQISKDQKYELFTDEELERAKNIMSEFVKNVHIR